MKKILTLLLLLIAGHFTYGQEQITDIKFNNKSVRHILREIGPDSYVITIDKQDSLKVYKINGSTSVYMHSRYYASLWNENSLKYTGRYILIENVKGSVSYNFVEDDEYWTFYEGKHNTNRWYGQNEDFVFLTHSDEDYKDEIHYLVDLKNKSKVVLSSNTYFWGVAVKANYFYVRDYDPVSKNYSHVFINRIDNSRDTVITIETYGSIYLGDSSFFYCVNLELFEFNYKSNATRKIGQLNSPYNFSFIEYKETYIVSNELNFNTYIQTINKNTLLTEVDSIEENFELPYKKIIQDKLIFNDNRFIWVYDLINKQTFKIQSFADDPTECAFLEDRYIVHKYFTNLMMIDLVTMKEDTLYKDLDYLSYFLKVESIKTPTGYLLNFDTKTENPFKLIEVNVEQKKAKVSNIVPQYDGGLIKGAKVVKLGNSIVLLTKTDVYHIVGNQVVKLNKLPIYKTAHDSYKINGDRLMWLEEDRDDINAYTFKNGVVTLHTTFSTILDEYPYSFSIYDFLITPLNTYFKTYAFVENYYKVNHATGVMEYIGIADITLSSDNLIESNGSVYFFSEKKLKVILPDGKIKSLFINFSTNGVLSLYRFKGNIYTFGNGGFYKIIGDGFELLLASNSTSIGFNNMISYSDYALVMTANKKYLFDGQSFFLFNTNLENGALLSPDIMAFVTSSGGNSRYTKLFNRTTQQFITLPDEIAYMGLATIFTNGGKRYLVAKSGSHPYITIHVFRINEDYTEFTQVKEFESSGWNTSVQFNGLGNEGMLYVGAKIHLMSDSLGFEYIPHLAGDEDAIGSVEQEGYYYFLAIHPENGRQLFRTKSIGLQVHTDDASHVQSLQLLPNPAFDNISINTDAKTNNNFTIYDINGNAVQQGRLDGDTIQIASLSSGNYFLIVTDENGKTIGASRFVKM